MALEWYKKETGYAPGFLHQGVVVRADPPIRWHTLSGELGDARYERVEREGRETVATAVVAHPGCRLEIADRWREESPGIFALRRKITDIQEGDAAGDGIRLESAFRLEEGIDARSLRLFVPTLCYSRPGELGPGSRTRMYMEDRLTAPVTLAYDPEKRVAVSLGKTAGAGSRSVSERQPGQDAFRHKTDLTSLGFGWEGERLTLRISFPYYEGEESVWRSAAREPVEAFYPLDGEPFSLTLHYLLHIGEEPTFSDAVAARFVDCGRRMGDAPVRLPFPVEDVLGWRCESLARCYREEAGNCAGFFFHFDPCHGYRSAPSGFGTSFHTIPHDTYTHILEYGFTGRQLNAAYILAEARGGEWLDRGERVVDFFLDRCMTGDGWCYSLYDLKAGAPFYSMGDRDAPKLHYVYEGEEKGNYLRTMTEPCWDLLLCYRLYRERGREHPEWLAAARRFADFLLRTQNGDGSWYRAYRPDGVGIGLAQADTEEKGFALKGATSIPLIFLCTLAELLGEEGRVYREAACRAGDFVLSGSVALEFYQGGTMDNPNVVDKEAAQYAMAGLYTLYRYTGDRRYVAGADSAAKQFITWNYIWNAPTLEGTYLDRKNFQTRAMGAINSIWGGGVVDIYSAFHIAELYALGREVGNGYYQRLASEIGVAIHQIVSHPGDDMGFADSGMQPEGFGICCQGADEGMIHKGDIWGTLGWIYSAGIFGVRRLQQEMNPEQKER